MTDDRRPEEEVTAEICAVCGHVFRPDETRLLRMRHAWDHERDEIEAGKSKKFFTPRLSKFDVQVWSVVL